MTSLLLLAVLVDTAEPGVNPDLERIDGIVDRLQRWYGTEAGLGSPGDLDQGPYRAMMPRIFGPEGMSRIGPSPEWKSFARSSKMTFASGEAVYQDLMYSWNANRPFLRTVSVGLLDDPERRHNMQDPKSWRFEDLDAARGHAWSVVDMLQVYDKSWDIVLFNENSRYEDPTPSYQFGVNWKGFVGIWGFGFTVHRTTGLISNLSFQGPLLDEPLQGDPMDETDAKYLANNEVRRHIFKPLMLVGSRKILSPYNPVDAEGNVRFLAVPVYEFQYVELTEDGQRNPEGSRYLASVDAISQKVLGVNLIEGSAGVLRNPAPLPAFTFNMAYGEIHLRERKVNLLACTPLTKLTDKPDRTGWYSQGDFLFPVAYNEATGEMEIRTPDQVRYYRLPPGTQTQAR